MKIMRPIVWTGTNVLSASAPNETAVARNRGDFQGPAPRINKKKQSMIFGEWDDSARFSMMLRMCSGIFELLFDR